MMAKCRGRVVFDFLFERLPIWALRFILFLVVVVAPFVHYGYVKTYLVDAQPLLLPGVLILGLALPLVTLMITRKYPAITGKFFVPLVLGGGVLLLCVQMFLVKGGLFETSWDVASVAIVHDRLNPDSLSYLQDYLSNNPNNTMINVIFSVVAAVGSALGITTYMALVLGGCLCVTISIVACTFAARHVFGERIALAFDVLASLYLGLNAWIFVPYTDTYGMLCPALVLFSITCIRDKRLAAVLVGLLSALGYAIKPTAIFTLLACCILALPRFVASAHAWLQKEKLHNKAQAVLHSRLFQVLLCGCMAFVIGWVACSSITTYREQQIGADTTKAKSVAHFLMMGANPESMGGFNGDDVNYTNSFTDPKERTAANIKEWLRRIEEMGPVGSAKLATRKTLTNFSDGTFAWEHEGRFYRHQLGNNSAIKAWYGIGEKGASINSGLSYELLCQMLWLVVLIGCACVPRNGVSSTEKIMRLALLMLALFLMFFEARARYLFLFAPYFVLLGVVGWFRIEKALCSFMREHLGIGERG